jgi:hypothetical protein
LRTPLGSLFQQFGVGLEQHASFPCFAARSSPEPGRASNAADIGAGKPRFVK